MKKQTMSKTDSNETDKEAGTRSWTGYALALLSSIFAAVGSLLIKIAAEDKMLIVLLRCMMQFLVLLPITTYKKLDVLGGSFKTFLLLLLRGILGSAAMNAYAEALNYLSVGDASAIVYTSPVFVMLFACICLKEPCGFVNGVLMVITVTGFVLVAQPSFIFGDLLEPHAVHLEGYRWLGIIYSLTCSICAALSTIIIRKLGFNVHYSLSLLYYAGENVTFIVSFRLATRQTFSFCSNYLLITISAGMTFFVAQLLTTLALQRQKAGSISLIRSSEVVFIYLLQYIVMGEIPTVLGGIGAALILLVCVMISAKSIWKTAKAKS